MSNELQNPSSGILGSAKALKLLSEKPSAKILVCSDTHGNYDILEDIILRYATDCDALVFCGDGICDFETYFTFCQTEKNLKDAMPEVFAFVRGNGDSSVMHLPDKKTKSVLVPQSVELTVCRKKILALHGHQVDVYTGIDGLLNWAFRKKPDAVFFGHTHIPEKTDFYNCLYLNPGSPSRPRSSSGPTIALVHFYSNGTINPEFFYL
jgi:putative phosphoesterase